MSDISLDEIEGPTYFICKKTLYNYEKGIKMGYNFRSKFLAGLIKKSVAPSWKGINGDKTYDDLLHELFDDNFSTNISADSKLDFIFPQGFCFNTSTKNDLQITTAKDDLEIYIVHESYYKKISINSELVIDLVLTSNTTFEYRNYRIDFKAIDNTVMEGQDCVDYRKMKISYGDCIYQAFIKKLYSIYGCFPPWVKTKDQKCDHPVESKKLEENIFEGVLEDFNSVTDGLDIEVQKKCAVPCYKIELQVRKMAVNPNFPNNAMLKIVHSNAVPVTKAVYSFNKFMLTVELGSALGLWLGMYFLVAKLLYKSKCPSVCPYVNHV